MLRASTFVLLMSAAAAAAAQVKNGFDLGESLIPATEIQRGGPPRDGIPSIDEPKFVHAEDADLLVDDDRVIGVLRNGVAKAYPIRILNWHEVVNDELDGAATLITYCPLCGTGMVFDVERERIESTFGVSGLLYNSDVLLYDRETESLWSQIEARAIAGPLKNTSLTLLPSQHTTWREWRAQYPDTLVLSTETGFRRNYATSPYLSYERTDRLMFDVQHRSDAYANKELVLGIADGEQARAYPFAELEAHGERRFTDVFAGREITIVWSEPAGTARVLDASGDEMPSVLAYWFAWYAFHPNTEIFRNAAQ